MTLGRITSNGRHWRDLACKLRLQAGKAKLGQMDECIAAGAETPRLTYQFIVREDLGSEWDDLSLREKNIAVEKATAAAQVDSELLSAGLIQIQ